MVGRSCRTCSRAGASPPLRHVVQLLQRPPSNSLNGRADALYVVNDALVVTDRNRINTWPLASRLPTMHGTRAVVEAGGLISYGPNSRTFSGSRLTMWTRFCGGRSLGTFVSSGRRNSTWSSIMACAVGPRVIEPERRRFRRARKRTGATLNRIGARRPEPSSPAPGAPKPGGRMSCPPLVERRR